MRVPPRACTALSTVSSVTPVLGRLVGDFPEYAEEGKESP